MIGHGATLRMRPSFAALRSGRPKERSTKLSARSRETSTTAGSSTSPRPSSTAHPGGRAAYGPRGRRARALRRIVRGARAARCWERAPNAALQCFGPTEPTASTPTRDRERNSHTVDRAHPRCAVVAAAPVLAAASSSRIGGDSPELSWRRGGLGAQGAPPSCWSSMPHSAGLQPQRSCAPVAAFLGGSLTDPPRFGHSVRGGALHSWVVQWVHV